MSISSADFIALASVVCTKSSTFIIEAYAGLNNKPARSTLEGIVERISEPGPIAPVIAGWSELPRPLFISEEEPE